uniref:ORF3 n=1 Tax=TTV-like mini virus TaxID=93678 RepID=A0A4Y5QRT5_9VIRU|nr:ORF3 [TTV-like mini virus]
MLFPITTHKQLRYRIQKQHQKHSYTPLTKDEDNLQKQLQNECKKTGKLKKLLSCLQSRDFPKKQQHKHRYKKRPRKKKKTTYSSSSTSSDSNSSDSSTE